MKVKRHKPAYWITARQVHHYRKRDEAYFWHWDDVRTLNKLVKI